MKTLGRQPPILSLTPTELHGLYMCRAFAEHLLGRGFLEDITRALDKGRALLPGDTGFSSAHFGAYRPGSIDYTPHQETIRLLLSAMEKKRICNIRYQTVMAQKPKNYAIKPYRLFSHQDTVYLHAGLARKPGERYKEPRYDPLLAVHRIKKAALDDRPFTIPENYDFEKAFNRNFGIIKQEAFEVTVEFTGFAAGFVSERILKIKAFVCNKLHTGVSMTMGYTTSAFRASAAKARAACNESQQRL